MSKTDQHRDAYKEEANELLAELETSLLELEESPDDPELIGCIFRALHTIKGSGAMFGFDDIASFTHEVETVFDMVRNGEMSVTKELVDLTLSARDHIKALLDNPDSIDKQKAGEIIASLKKLSPDTKEQKRVNPCSPAPPPYGNNPESEPQERNITYRIRFRPPPDIFTKGINPVLLINELSTIGDCRIAAQTDTIPQLNDINPEFCYTYWDVILTTSQGINAIKDIFIFIEDECELDIDVIDDSRNPDEESGYTKLRDVLVDRGYITRDDFQKITGTHKRIGEILVERGDIRQEDLQKILVEQKPVGEMLVDAGLVDAGKVESALTEQQHVNNVRQKQQKTDPVSSIRVSSDKLDRLVDLVGELVTVQARLTQTAATTNDPELLLVAEEVERLTNELRDNTMSVRMVTIGTMFSKFKRLVRDLSGELGKEVEMSTEGAETELDKTVIDKLNDPLVHLIRNSIDHGIEAPDVRNDYGKPGQGIVHLSARHSGANVLIEIMDNGAGLNPEAICDKAVEKGLIEPDAELSEKDTFALILAPGFSTAGKITGVSGRGVGMDVVKRSIDALRGSIDISSERGIGTTITLKLPLTLAIIDGLLVKIGHDFFVLPLSLVEECVELTKEDVAGAHGRQIANVRGEIVPYISLREQFMINGGKPDIEQIVITEIDSHRVGFVVDHVIGEHQTVIKTLGRVYRDVEGVSGATILGDGTVALILDVPKLVQNVEKEEVIKN
ncbi:MAG TPA: chemotaxis protein CheA [Nitrospirae bacterium]|nr:chemotaxis protein CheA [Nitrospirota bacterium]